MAQIYNSIFTNNPRIDDPHTHETSHLAYLDEGRATLCIENQVTVLSSKICAWIPANTVHYVQAFDEVELRCVYFDVDAPFDFPKEKKIFATDNLLRALILKISQFSFEEELTARQVLLVETLFSELEAVAPCLTEIKLPRDKRLQKVLNLIYQHETANLSIDELAKEAAMSNRNLTRLFKSQTGLPVSQWIREYKLIRAVELLSSNHSVSETASRLGFSSDSAFIKAFKAYFSQTPRQMFR